MPRKKRRKERPLTRSEQMARIRSGDTGPELALRRLLWREGFRYRVRPGIPGRPDVAFISRRIAVFVDGCFWHGCPEHYATPGTNTPFWKAKISRNIARDEEVNRQLQELGWTVLRFWEHDIEGEIDSVIVAIRDALRNSS